MGNSASNEDLGNFVKSSSYSTLNLNKKLNVYSNQHNSSNNNSKLSSYEVSCRRKKSASTSSLSNLNTKFPNPNDKNFRYLFVGK